MRSADFRGCILNRWLGHEATDLEFAQAVLEKMKGIPYEKRTARLGGVMAFYDGGDPLVAENWIDGHISEELLTPIQPGFPYRSVLFIDALQKPYGLFTEEEHTGFNHRFKNIAVLRPAILARLF